MNITDSPNSPPVVGAGADQEVVEGATVTLSGTSRSGGRPDVLVDPRRLPQITFANQTALSTSFTAPDVAADTTITVTLTANDGTVEVSDALQVNITDSPNSPPVVGAGADQEVVEGATVTLSGTANDADPEDDLTYSWTHDGSLTITFANQTALSTSFTAPDVAADTTITVTLTANDGTVEVSDALQVNITDSPNSPPVVGAGADQEVAEGATVTLSGTANDADPEDDLTYSWTHDGSLTITFANQTALSTSFTAPDVAADTTITVTLTANDGTVEVSDALQVNITDSPNSPPVVGAGADQEVVEGATVTLSGTANDADPEDDLTYSWTHDGSLTITFANQTALSTSFTAPDVAADTTITVTLTANDGTVDVSDALQVNITDSPNSPPVVGAGADQEVAEGATVSLSGTATDGDPEDDLTYSWTHDGSLTITFANQTALSTSFTAPDVAADTTITVTLTANDGTVDVSDALQVNITDSPNSPPVVGAGADQEVAEGATVTLSGTANDADPEDDLTYSWTHDGSLTITFANQTALSTSFTAPDVAADTTITVTLTANDGTVEVSDALQVNITDSPNSPPVVGAGADQEVVEGATVSLSGTATDGDPEDDLTYSWTHDGSLTITFANQTALSTSFTAPDVAADTTITVTLTANDGTVEVSDALQVNITDSPNSPPVVGAGADQEVVEGATVSLSGTATDGDPEDDLTYSWTHDGSLTITFANQTALSTSFTAPDVAADTTITVTLTANDGTVEVSDALQVNITDSPNSPPVVGAGADQEVAEGATVSLSGTATDGDPEDDLTYSWTHDSDLAITITGSDSASASFTAPNVAANTTVTVTLTVNDGTVDVSDALRVTVTDSPNTPPTVEAGPDQTVDEGATVTLSGTATDADPEDTLTYSWNQTSGTAVALSGGNTASPTFTAPLVESEADLVFELTVGDGAYEDTDTVTITVLDGAGNMPNADAGPDRAVDEGDPVTLDGTGSSDPDGDQISYSWRQISGIIVKLSGGNTASPTFVASSVSSLETLVFELTVSDGTHSNTDTVTVVIGNRPDALPTAVNPGSKGGGSDSSSGGSPAAVSDSPAAVSDSPAAVSGSHSRARPETPYQPALDLNTVLLSKLAAIPSAALQTLDTFDPFVPVLPINALDLPLNIDGTGYPLGGLINTLDPHQIAVGKPVRMTFTVYDRSDIVHFAVYLNLHGSDAIISNSDTYIRFDNGHVSVTDPNGFIADASITVETDMYRQSKKRVQLDTEFEDGMGLTSMAVRVVDEKSRSTTVQILDALGLPEPVPEPEPEPEPIPEPEPDTRTGTRAGTRTRTGTRAGTRTRTGTRAGTRTRTDTRTETGTAGRRLPNCSDDIRNLAGDAGSVPEGGSGTCRNEHGGRRAVHGRPLPAVLFATACGCRHGAGEPGSLGGDPDPCHPDAPDAAPAGPGRRVLRAAGAGPRDGDPSAKRPDIPGHAGGGAGRDQKGASQAEDWSRPVQRRPAKGLRPDPAGNRPLLAPAARTRRILRPHAKCYGRTLFRSGFLPPPPAGRGGAAKRSSHQISVRTNFPSSAFPRLDARRI